MYFKFPSNLAQFQFLGMTISEKKTPHASQSCGGYSSCGSCNSWWGLQSDSIRLLMAMVMALQLRGLSHMTSTHTMPAMQLVGHRAKCTPRKHTLRKGPGIRFEKNCSWQVALSCREVCFSILTPLTVPQSYQSAIQRDNDGASCERRQGPKRA